jgi:PPM family protein phosphatase
MGTTLVCACLSEHRIMIGNVGDSRAYLIRNGVCTQITLDHSLLDEQVRQGLITPEMAAASHLQSVITRAIGTANEVEADLFAAELNLNDMFPLCEARGHCSGCFSRCGIDDNLSELDRPRQATRRRG